MSDEKSFQYVKIMLPLFRAVVNVRPLKLYLAPLSGCIDRVLVNDVIRTKLIASLSLGQVGA